MGNNAKAMKQTIQGILRERVVAYHPLLAKAFGGVGAGVFLSQILYWSDKGTDPDGWIYKTQEALTNETGLSRKEQETARRHLVSHGILEEERRGLPARLYYRILWDPLIDKLDAQIGQTGVSQPDNLDAPNGQSFITENTSDTTTEILAVEKSTAPSGRRKQTTVIDDAFRERMREKYRDTLGGEVDFHIDQALNHKASLKTLDLGLYVQGWLNREAKNRPARPRPVATAPDAPKMFSREYYDRERARMRGEID